MWCQSQPQMMAVTVTRTNSVVNPKRSSRLRFVSIARHGFDDPVEAEEVRTSIPPVNGERLGSYSAHANQELRWPKSTRKRPRCGESFDKGRMLRSLKTRLHALDNSGAVCL
jgi:hypothetical protein